MAEFVPSIVRRTVPEWLGPGCVFVEVHFGSADEKKYSRHGVCLIVPKVATSNGQTEHPPFECVTLFQPLPVDQLLAKIPALTLSEQTVLDYFRTVVHLLAAGEYLMESPSDLIWSTPLLAEELGELSKQLQSRPLRLTGSDENVFRVNATLFSGGSLSEVVFEIERITKQSIGSSLQVGFIRPPVARELMLSGLPRNATPRRGSRPGLLLRMDEQPMNGWEWIPAEDIDPIVEDINRRITPHLHGVVAIKRRRLTCYDRDLLQITSRGGSSFNYFVWIPGDATPVATSSAPIHALNDRLARKGWLLRTAEQAADYVRFFGDFVWGEDPHSLESHGGRAPFTIIESANHPRLPANLADPAVVADGDLELARAKVGPLISTRVPGEPSKFDVTGCTLFGSQLWLCTFRVEASGSIEMIDNSTLVTLKGVTRAVEGSALETRGADSDHATHETAKKFQAKLVAPRVETATSLEIRGVVVMGNLDLEGASLVARTRICHCRFRGFVSLASVEASRNVTFEDCVFEAGFGAPGAKFQAGIEFLRCAALQPVGSRISIALDNLSALKVRLVNVAAVGDVTLMESTIEHHIDIESFVTGGGLNLYGTSVERNYVHLLDVDIGEDLSATFLRCGTMFALDSTDGKTRIRGELDLGGAHIPQLLRIRAARVDRSILAINGSLGEVQIVPRIERKNVDPPSIFPVRVGGDIDLSTSEIDGHLSILGVEGTDAQAANATDGAATPHSRQLLLRHAVITGDLSLWGAGKQRLRELLGSASSGAVGAETCLHSSFPGGLHLAKVSVGGDVDLSHVQASDSVIDLEDATVSRDVIIAVSPNAAASSLAPARAKGLMLEGLECKGNVDLRCIDLIPSGRTGVNRRPGAIVARYAQIRKLLQLSDMASAAVPCALDLTGSELGGLEISAASFTGTVSDDELKKSGIILNRARIKKVTVATDGKTFPSPIDLRNNQVTWWEFHVGHHIQSDNAQHYIELLNCDPNLQRNTYRLLENTLFNQGHEESADSIHRAMRAWLRGSAAKNLQKGSGFWTVLGSRVLLTGRQVWDAATGSVTTPYRLLVLVLAWTCLSTAWFTIPMNVAPSEQALAASFGALKPSDTPEPSSWGISKAAWVALRHHIPVIVINAEDEWEPANERPLEIGGGYTSRILTAEDYANGVLVLHWIFWPVILVIFSKRFLRRALN
jgi:hypothetical protein